MKKIYLLLALTAGLVSCDMDKEPYDALPDTEALQTPTDFANARVGLYSGLRSSVGGDDFYNAAEIQCDGFNAVTGFSNTLGDMYTWDFTTSAGYFSTVYGNYQAIIARANYIIDGYNKCNMSNSNVFTAAAIQNVKAAKGDAFFMRAYCIFMLSQYFCADYDAATANNENTGVSYRLDYAPSADASTYPGRKTLAQTMTQVTEDLDSAAKYISETNAPLSVYVTPDAITALRARQALAMDNYDDALKYAESLITSGTYALADGVDELKALWQEDAGMETIFQLAVASRDELPAASGTRYQPYATDGTPDYIPTQTLVDLYSDNDYRKTVYFNQVQINTTSGASATVYALNKYVDHGRLYNEFDGYEYARFTIEPKVFRIAEMYLIAIEASIKSSKTEKYNAYLNELLSKRIGGYEERQFNETTAWTELQNERTREMVAEGSRLFDIKRWHIKMERGVPQDESICNLPGANTTELSRPVDEKKFTWPIPKHEIDVNKKVVQNPGY